MKLTRRETTFIDAIEQVEEPPAAKRQRILQFVKPSKPMQVELQVRAEVLGVLEKLIGKPYVPSGAERITMILREKRRQEAAEREEWDRRFRR